MSDDLAYDAVRRDGVLQVGRPGTEWLSTGWDGGRRVADYAYNVSVPEGWERTDLGAYVDERLERADLGQLDADTTGPALLTGVDIADARGARRGPVTAYATAGVSNPAALPMDPAGETASDRDGLEGQGQGTVNVIVGTTRALASGALANLIAVVAEAKTATLLAETGFPGTTTDAIIVGHDPSGTTADFSGSGTEVGSAARACVRDALRTSLRAHYADGDVALPESVADATYGVSTDERAEVFRPRSTDEAPEPEG
ncbi:adenosylcobinamide amidohydrolase [Natrinema sp. 1APR25-10V2]|uniref:adenosylcobinamide amidohydrolase n=1 Tax=Natrinema sp. 1APR25-10V2 TaxID=2951081 RepID=UPI00287709F1|nr:adenosylcobinamide amidohydrolase [Natrinema sp. 1APR25-10V2]MDS0475860.1 adenosylcobinamide amidohydrolase [Natrinema sp. 1APR25-10V2]